MAFYPSETPSRFPNAAGGLFLLAWLALLTRRFRGPEGSALVPGAEVVELDVLGEAEGFFFRFRFLF